MKLVSVIFILLISALCTDLNAATLYVANNGIDSATCGTEDNPCRSITLAMFNASAGDTILVGPGRYGDLTDGRDFTFPGEEAVIDVNKPLTIESSHGAYATRIFMVEVHIQVDGVVFGRHGKGFYFQEIAGRSGVILGAGTSGNSVSGNIAPYFEVKGDSHSLTHNKVFVGTRGDSRFVIEGTGHTISNNTMSVRTQIRGGSIGHSLIGNLFVGAVCEVEGTDIEIRRNSFIGSGGAAVSLSDQDTMRVTINENNFFANSPPVGNLEGNCAIVNGSGMEIDATNNYWGAATGPGLDPADNVCNGNDSITLVTPFATQPFESPSESPGGGGTNGNPICAAAQPVPNVLWPANHHLVPVWIIGITDPDNDPIAISITGVTQDEPLNGLGDGDVAPDAVVYGSSVALRAERSGSGNGRVYKVQFTANDGKGGSCTGTVTVGVPNSQKPNQVIVDDGQVFNSTQL